MCSCFEDLYKNKEFVSGSASSQTELLAIYGFPEKLFSSFCAATSASVYM